jgi:phenylacetate-CoA ligase
VTETASLEQQLRRTIAHFYQHAPAFRRRLDDAGLVPADIQSIADLSRLPILRKDDLIVLQRESPPFGGLLAVPVSQLRRVFQSPGPINEPGAARPDSGRWAVALRAAGFQPGEIVLNAFGYHMTPAGSSLENSLHTVGCVVIPGGIGNQEQQVQMMASFAVTGYVGLPSYLKALLDKAQDLGHSLQLQRAFVLAEPLPPSLRQELNERGVSVLQGYGTAECGNLGYECEQMTGWHIPEGVIVQVCDINSGQPLPPGESGEVVATLLNEHYAIIRFGVGDLSSINDEPCPCGRPSLRLNGWQGRVGEATKVRGMFLHPRQLARMMARFPEVAAYQAVITREAHRDELALRVVPAATPPAADLVSRLQETARQALKFRFQVQLVDAAALPPGSPTLRDERSWD